MRCLNCIRVRSRVEGNIFSEIFLMFNNAKYFQLQREWTPDHEDESRVRRIMTSSER